MAGSVSGGAGWQAEVDQARAGTDAQLDVILAEARRIAAAKGESSAMADTALALSKLSDDVSFGLLLAAVWRLLPDGTGRP